MSILASHSASTRPVGPAPTMRIGLVAVMAEN
jgi:hypothetical protein